MNKSKNDLKFYIFNRMEIDSRTGKTLKETLIELYLDVKVRDNEEVYFCQSQIENFDNEKYDAEKLHLINESPFVILEGIRSSFETLTDIRKEIYTSQDLSKSKSQRNKIEIDEEKNYNELLQNLEKEVRDHIGIEQQMKLYAENLQNKIEESQIEKKKLSLKIATLEENLKEFAIKYNELKKTGGEHS